MADSLIQAELLAACSGLGYSDGIRYYREADCLETVKDLIRYLRRDDDSHEIRRALGETKVLQTDLIPIIKFYSDDKELFDVTLRLLVNLTNPVLLLFKEELPEEKVTRQQYLQMIGHQQAFKEAFADEGVCSVLVTQLGAILKKDWEEREEEERLIVERILILVRNVLSVAGSPDDEKRTDDDASLHDQVLWALHLARFEDLILYIASSDKEQDLCMHVIEIISLMLKEQNPAHLANAGLQRSQSEKEKDDKDLLELRKREAHEKQARIRKHYSARHSRFSGTYYVMNMKSISDRDVIAHRHISDTNAINFDKSKAPRKIRRDKVPLKDVDITRRSTLAIRLFLQEFCIEFLNGVFNSLMYIVKDNLNRAKAQEHDESYYFWAMKFFLEFNRNYNFKIELITETLTVESFHYIQVQVNTYYETMTTDKKKIPLWSRRMHNGLKAYQELLMTLSFMDKSPNSDVRESSKVLKNKVFYIDEYRELVLVLLQNYDELKMSKGYLRDLIETAHVFMKLLEGVCGKQKHLLVQTKAKRKKQSKKGKTKNPVNNPLTEDELLVIWEEKSNDILAILNGESGEQLPTTMPYDPVAEISEEEQKEVSMKKLNHLLRNGEFHEAVSLLRSCREVWPEGDIFGAGNSEPLEELLCLRLIFMANLNDATVETPADDNDDDDNEEEFIEDSHTEQRHKEQEFNFIAFVRRFAHTKVLQAYALIFRNFFSNTEAVNHCILRMYHRLAWDCKIPAIFFQASLFRTFQIILDQPVTGSQAHKDAIKFSKFIFRKFVEVSGENEKVCVELLFWKNRQEALEIETGYEDGSSKTKASSWSEEEENELETLYREFKDSQEEGKDVVDLITENLINQNHTRRMVIKKLKEMNLVQDVKELRKNIKIRAPLDWAEEEIEELQRLVEEYKDAVNPMELIMANLKVNRSKKKVVDKIMELGLVQSRKDLRKKRTNKTRSRNTGEHFLEMNECEGEDSDESVDRDSDDDNNDDDLEPSRSPIPRRTSQKKADSKPASVPLTPALIQSNLTKVIEGGMEEAVEWIADLMQETAEERENDGDFEPVPLVSITESINQAMENEDFLELLRSVGIRSPKEQESFWRIPSNISIDGLKKRAQFLKERRAPLDVDANSLIEESPMPSPLKITKAKSKKGQKIDSPGKENEERRINQSLGDEGDSDTPISQIFDKTVGDVRNKNSDSDESVPVLRESENLRNRRTKRPLLKSDENNYSKTSGSKSKKRRIINESDDDDDESLRLHLDTELTENIQKDIASADSVETTEPLINSVAGLKRKPTVLLSDDDETDEQSFHSCTRRIIDDSDED